MTSPDSHRPASTQATPPLAPSTSRRRGPQSASSRGLGAGPRILYTVGVALTATLYRFQLELSDIDRGVYTSLDLRVPRHPSEDEERMIVRVLARALVHDEGLEFGRGLSNTEDATLWKRSGGEVETWIDVGMPSAERLHRASKRAREVVVVTRKSDTVLRKEWSSRSVHRAEDITVIRLDPKLVSALAEDLARSVTWYVMIQDGVLSVAEGERSCSGALARMSLAEFLRAPG